MTIVGSASATSPTVTASPFTTFADIGFATGKFFQEKGFEVVLTGINDDEINSRPSIENISYEILDVTSENV